MVVTRNPLFGANKLQAQKSKKPKRQSRGPSLGATIAVPVPAVAPSVPERPGLTRHEANCKVCASSRYETESAAHQRAPRRSSRVASMQNL